MLCIPLGPQIQQEPVPGDLNLFSQVGVVHVVYGERGWEIGEGEKRVRKRQRWSAINTEWDGGKVRRQNAMGSDIKTVKYRHIAPVLFTNFPYYFWNILNLLCSFSFRITPSRGYQNVCKCKCGRSPDWLKTDHGDVHVVTQHPIKRGVRSPFSQWLGLVLVTWQR